MKTNAASTEIRVFTLEFHGHRWGKPKLGWPCYLCWTQSGSWGISWSWEELVEKYWMCRAEISLPTDVLLTQGKMTADLIRFKAGSVKACSCCKLVLRLWGLSVSSSSSPSPCLLPSIGKLCSRGIARRNGKAACGRGRYSSLRRAQLLWRCIRLSSKSLRAPFWMPRWYLWWRRGFLNRLQSAQ